MQPYTLSGPHGRLLDADDDRLGMGSGRTPYTPHPVEMFPSLKDGTNPQGDAAKRQPAKPNAK